ncbi:unnamed protein product [Lampetra planeri]
MVLDQVAYPRLNETALDPLAIEKMLVLAQEMGVVLPIVEEAQTSLWVTRCLQVHEGMNRRPRVVAWSGDPMSGGASTARNAAAAADEGDERTATRIGQRVPGTVAAATNS